MLKWRRSAWALWRRFDAIVILKCRAVSFDAEVFGFLL
jgi:hypothetical protein